MPKKIILTRQFIVDCVYGMTASKIYAFHCEWLRKGIYRLLIYRGEKRFIVSFSEEELLGYGTKEWNDRVWMKIKEELIQRWKTKIIMVVGELANFIICQLKNKRPIIISLSQEPDVTYCNHLSEEALFWSMGSIYILHVASSVYRMLRNLFCFHCLSQ